MRKKIRKNEKKIRKMRKKERKNEKKRRKKLEKREKMRKKLLFSPDLYLPFHCPFLIFQFYSLYSCCNMHLY